MITRYSLACDPGWKNLGWALVSEESGVLRLVSSGVLNPSELGVLKTVEFLLDASHAFDNLNSSYSSIERYVSYQGVNTAEAENILMLIGSLSYALQKEYAGLTYQLSTFRAIEWKTELVKTLFKHKGFTNPGTSLDKKFSIAAAHACLDIPGVFKTDHEADAICLACLPFLREKYGTKPKQTTK